MPNIKIPNVILMSRCYLISSFYSIGSSVIMRCLPHICAITFIFTYVIPIEVIYAMEPSPESSIKEIKSDLDYWRGQAKNYRDARAAMYKPESTWTEEERISAEEVQSIGEFSPEMIESALKDIQNNIDSSRVDLAKTVPKFSDTLSKDTSGNKSGDSSSNPPSKPSKKS